MEELRIEDTQEELELKLETEVDVVYRDKDAPYISFDENFAAYIDMETSPEGLFTFRAKTSSDPDFNFLSGNLTSIDAPNLTTTGNYFAYNCPNLTSIDAPNLTTTGNYFVYNCPNLTSIDAPNLTTTGDYFAYNTGIEEVNYEFESIGSYAFPSNKKLKKINLPKLKKAGDYAFTSCSLLTEVNLPEYGESYGRNDGTVQLFSECSSLEKLVLPKCKTSGYQWLRNCYNLKWVELPSLEYVSYWIFTNTYQLTTIVFGADKMVSMYNSSEVTSSYIQNCYHLTGTVNETYNPDGLKDCYIYVNDNLVEQYKSNAQWKVVADQFKPLSELPTE